MWCFYESGLNLLMVTAVIIILIHAGLLLMVDCREESGVSGGVK
jgi:hypothetical protein